MPVLLLGNRCLMGHQKCDANRPYCTTCSAASKQDECQYDDEIRQSFAAALLLRARELEDRLAHYETQERHMSQPPEMPPDLAAELSALNTWQYNGTDVIPPPGPLPVHSTA